MTDKISEYILKALYKDEELEEDNKEIIIFNIKRLIGEISKIIVIVIISLILNIFKEFLIVFCINVLYKSFVGGAHAKSNLQCLIFSILFYILPALLSKYVDLSRNILYVSLALVFIQSIYVILKIVPADTENVPILVKKTRIKMKIFSFISLILIFFAAIFVFFYNNEILKIIITTLFFINFITYKIVYRFFKCRYSYESSDLKQYYNL